MLLFLGFRQNVSRETFCFLFFQLLIAKYILIYPKYDDTMGSSHFFQEKNERITNVFIHFHISLCVECFAQKIPLFIKNAKINVSRETFSRFR